MVCREAQRYGSRGGVRWAEGDDGVLHVGGARAARRLCGAGFDVVVSAEAGAGGRRAGMINAGAGAVGSNTRLEQRPGVMRVARNTRSARGQFLGLVHLVGCQGDCRFRGCCCSSDCVGVGELEVVGGIGGVGPLSRLKSGALSGTRRLGRPL